MSEDERRATHMRHAEALPDCVMESDAFYKKGGDNIKSAIALFDVERRNIEAGQDGRLSIQTEMKQPHGCVTNILTPEHMCSTCASVRVNSSSGLRPH